MANQTDNKKSVIAYIRVSTKRQGEHGIGLEGQKEALQAYADLKKYRIEEFFQDIESGRGRPSPKQRTGLRSALSKARDFKIPVLAYSWDRLARSVTLSKEIMDSGVDIYSVLKDGYRSAASLKAEAVRADHEGKRISERTIDGMKKRKLEGAVFGNPKNLGAAGKKGAEANAQRSLRKVTEIADFLQKRPDYEKLTTQQVSSLLNEAGILTNRFGDWNKESLRKPLRQAKEILLERTTRAEAEQHRDDPLWGSF